MPIDPGAVQWDAAPAAAPAIDPTAVQWDEAPRHKGGLERVVMGPLRGARDVVDTGALWIAKALDKLSGNDKSITGLVTGQPTGYEAMVRAGNKQGQDEYAREYGDSWLSSIGRLVGNVAATAPVGGLLAAPLRGIVPRLATAVETAGMRTGAPAPTTLAGRTADLGLRTTGGAVTGGASAGLVDPEHADVGALIGGALPGAAKVAGATGDTIRRLVRGPEQSPDLAAAIQKARDAGYVIPPSQARPSLVNRTLEGISGKITTAQNASVRNSATTAKIVAEDLGLPADTKITQDVLRDVRKTAHSQGYAPVKAAGTITPGPSYAAALDSIEAPALTAAKGFPNAPESPVIKLVESLRSPSFDAASAVEKVSALRSAADDAYRTGNSAVGKASKDAANAIEDAIEAHLQASGQGPLLQQFRDSRQLIAKTHDVGAALNTETGAIDARKLAALLQRGKPLSGGVEEAARFAARFPKAAQSPEVIGSLPQTSPLDWHAASATSMATGNPLPMLGVAARPAARSLVLSPIVQNRLVQSQGLNALQRLLQSDPLSQLAYRSGPVVGSD